MILSLSIALAATPSGAAHWRVAAIAENAIAYVTSERVHRRSRKVRFLMKVRFRRFEGSILDAVCNGEYRSGPIEDPERDAASRFAD